MLTNWHQRENPQKDFLYIISKCLYYTGMGNCWYEGENQTHRMKVLYAFWCITSHVFLVSVLIGMVACTFRTDLTLKEKNDALQFASAHPSIYLKFVFFCFQRHRIRDLLKKLLEDTRSIYVCKSLEVSALKRSTVFSIGVAAPSFFTVIAAYIEGILIHFRDGIPIRTEITYWPTKYDTSYLADIVRIILHIHWIYLMFIMVMIDVVCLTCLIILRYKFKMLHKYFLELPNKFLNSDKSKTEKEKEMKKDVVKGIKLQTETLWCTGHIQKALGSTYSLIVVQSLALIVVALLKLVTTERSVANFSAVGTYLSTIFIISALYMTSGGDITHEASEVSTCVFHCGWELCSYNAALRPLVIMAIQMNQLPVYMTAFGILNLSYTNYIMILKWCYSFFAVMY